MPSNFPFFIHELFEIRPKSVLSASALFNGWYIINLLFNLTSYQTFNYLARNGVNLETKDMIQSGWYRMYLNTSQIQFLLKSNLAALHSIIRGKTVLSESNSYLVYGSSDFKPPTEYAKIDENLYIVKNITSIRNDPRVLKIKPHSQPILDNRYSGGYSETLNEIPSYDKDGIFRIPRPLNEIGLDGRNQVVSVSDSGLDVNHCFFHDPHIKTPFDAANFMHRKVVLYDPVADDLECERGHGTHVCGIIAGRSHCSKCGIENYNGVAPSAKLYMHDLGNLKDGGGSIIDINLPYFVERMRYAKSFIASNSWGYSTGEEEIRASFSKHAFANPDILFVFACGNSYSSYTIHTPSNSKNVLAVGALTSPYGSRFESSSDALFFNEESKHRTKLVHNSGPTVADMLKSAVPTTYIDRNVVIINPDEQYSKYNAVGMNQSVVIIDNRNFENVFQSSPCDFALTKVNNASLIIFAKKVNVACQPKYGNVNVPILSIDDDKFDGSFLSAMKSITVQPNYNGKSEPVTKLPLSSQGPSSLGYTKPEIVASGQNIQSARAGSPWDKQPRECSTNTIITKSGTSMATPVAAGIMTIVRQFFADGWYPCARDPELSDTECVSARFVPRSTLLRAFAVNSANRVGTMIETGFGVMNPFAAFGFATNGLRISDSMSIGSEKHHVYQISIEKEGQPLTVTMSYLDPPLPAESYLPLFADLDLVVISPSGQIFKGNGFENLVDEDQFATTEKVIIDNAPKGKYFIHVISSSFSMPAQVPYSIVVNGNFNQTNFALNPPFLHGEVTEKCYGACKYGKCVSGVCVCDDSRYGHLCTQKVLLSTLEYNEIELKNKMVSYYKYKVVKVNNQSKFFFNISFENSNKNGIGYCFNFDSKALKLASPNQQCFFQKKQRFNVSFSSENFPQIKEGSFVVLSIYSVTKDYSVVDIKVSGVETRFHLVYWFTHLPLWMMVAVASAGGVVLVLVMVILMLIFVKPSKKRSKKDMSIVSQIEENPHPTLIEHDPNDNISIDENLL